MIRETVVTSSAEETEAYGAKIAGMMKQHPEFPTFFALYGDLGVGKTAFVRGFASVISPASAVRSPTYTIVNEYRSGTRPLFHFDMYRIEDEDDLTSIGFDDYLTRGGICVVEWSEKIPYALPDRYFRVTIRKLPEESLDKRSILLEEVEETRS